MTNSKASQTRRAPITWIQFPWRALGLHWIHWDFNVSLNDVTISMGDSKQHLILHFNGCHRKHLKILELGKGAWNDFNKVQILLFAILLQRIELIEGFLWHKVRAKISHVMMWDVCMVVRSILDGVWHAWASLSWLESTIGLGPSIVELFLDPTNTFPLPNPSEFHHQGRGGGVNGCVMGVHKLAL